MSIGDFPGRWNWGYDGVLLYAPDASYGRPEELKALVDAAHALGIMVILDVVYNHFGPEGNYMPQYFPDIVTERVRDTVGAGAELRRAAQRTRRASSSSTTRCTGWRSSAWTGCGWMRCTP